MLLEAPHPTPSIFSSNLGDLENHCWSELGERDVSRLVLSLRKPVCIMATILYHFVDAAKLQPCSLHIITARYPDSTAIVEEYTGLISLIAQTEFLDAYNTVESDHVVVLNEC